MPIPVEYALAMAPPPADHYLRLRRESGLSPITHEQAAGPLVSSWRWCTVTHRPSGETAAMGRIIGDGGWYFHIADMATLPAHQRRGLGRAVLDALVAEVDRHAPPDPYVTLLADEPGRPLYTSSGFVPTAPHSIGMVLRRP
jgi:GNAT superfamily N-acetyltransferase